MAEKPISEQAIEQAVVSRAEEINPVAEKAADHQVFSAAVQQRAFDGEGSVFRKPPNETHWTNKVKGKEAPDSEDKSR